MLTLFRAMSETEFHDTMRYKKLSWNTTHKWFGTEEFVTQRVQDGAFNNSNFVEGRYDRLVKFVFSEDSYEHFSKCGFREFMLSRRKAPLVKILSITPVN